MVTRENLEPLILEFERDEKSKRALAVDRGIGSVRPHSQSAFFKGPTVDEATTFAHCFRLGVAIYIIDLGTERRSPSDDFQAELRLAYPIWSGYGILNVGGYGLNLEPIFYDQILPFQTNLGYINARKIPELWTPQNN